MGERWVRVTRDVKTTGPHHKTVASEGDLLGVDGDDGESLRYLIDNGYAEEVRVVEAVARSGLRYGGDYHEPGDTLSVARDDLTDLIARNLVYPSHDICGNCDIDEDRDLNDYVKRRWSTSQEIKGYCPEHNAIVCDDGSWLDAGEIHEDFVRERQLEGIQERFASARRIRERGR